MIQFTAEEVRAIAKRAHNWPDALIKMKSSCEFLFQYGIKVPMGTKSTWVMFFQCPKDSARLVYNYAVEDEYTCPVCGCVYRGEPYMGAWWRITVEKVLDGAYFCAAIWMMTGEEKYFFAAREALLRFADNYSGYELHGGIPYNNPGRISSQTLCEAMALRSICMTYDILRDALIPLERGHIEDNLLTPSSLVLVTQRMNQLHNHEVVIDSALGIAGLLLARPEFLEIAINGKYGLKYQLMHGTLSDGLWFEGTLHYHYFTLDACMLFERFARGTIYSLINLNCYEKMYAMPLRILQPDLCTPCLGDTGKSDGLDELAEHYEYPYRLFKSPFMAQVLNQAYQTIPRNSAQALLFGEDNIEDTAPMVLTNYHDTEGSGLTVLHEVDGRYLLFKHGKYGGEHDHYDKLSIHFMVGDIEVLCDLGTVGYGAPHHYRYFKNTFTHNTVCINGMNQPPANGKIIQYSQRIDGVLVEGYADWCGDIPTLDSLTISQWHIPSYKGVEMRRAILFGKDYFIEAFLVRGAEGRTVDWVVHPQGREELPPADYHGVEPALEGSVSQAFLNNARSFITCGVTETRWHQSAGVLRLFSACNQLSEMIYAHGPDNPPERTLCYAIHRVRPQDSEVLYMNVFAYGEIGAGITSVSLAEASPGEILAEIAFGQERRTHRFHIGELVDH